MQRAWTNPARDRETGWETDRDQAAAGVVLLVQEVAARVDPAWEAGEWVLQVAAAWGRVVRGVAEYRECDSLDN